MQIDLWLDGSDRLICSSNFLGVMKHFFNMNKPYLSLSDHVYAIISKGYLQGSSGLESNNSEFVSGVLLLSKWQRWQILVLWAFLGFENDLFEGVHLKCQKNFISAFTKTQKLSTHTKDRPLSRLYMWSFNQWNFRNLCDMFGYAGGFVQMCEFLSDDGVKVMEWYVYICI